MYLLAESYIPMEGFSKKKNVYLTLSTLYLGFDWRNFRENSQSAHTAHAQQAVWVGCDQ
jgi:hypothetical protein